MLKSRLIVIILLLEVFAAAFWLTDAFEIFFEEDNFLNKFFKEKVMDHEAVQDIMEDTGFKIEE